MILALLLAAAAPVTAIDAERSFAADAQKLGQWTAFRKWASADALMFVPQPTKAQAFLKGRKDPPRAVYWWPGRSYVSCDGTVAINTGPWVRDYGKSVGYFTTVWVRQKDGGWKWIYDAGDEDKFMRGEGGDIAPVIAVCPARTMPLPPQIASNGSTIGGSQSRDGSIAWGWSVGKNGSRQFMAFLWDGKQRQMVIEDKVAAPK